MDGILMGIITVTGILAAVYLVFRFLHSSGGRGGSVGPADIFMTIYSSAFLVFILANLTELSPELLFLAVMGIMGVIIWILTASETVRGSLWTGFKNFIGY